MVPWMQIYANLPNNSKTYLLAQTLNLSNVQAVGILICIWSWVSINTPDGNLSKYPDPRKIIEEITMWKKKKIDIYQSLIDTKWLDIIDGQCVIHDWNDYSAAGFKLKKQNAERQQRFRDKNKNKNNVTDNVTSRSTVHDSTVHNSTVHNSTNTEQNITLSEPEVEIERENKDTADKFEKCKEYYRSILHLDDVPGQAIGVFLKALNNDIELELIERVISDSADKNTPAAWLKVVVDNFVRDGVKSLTQYRGKRVESQSDIGSFETDEFFQLALKRTYEEMEKKESPAIFEASD